MLPRFTKAFLAILLAFGMLLAAGCAPSADLGDIKSGELVRVVDGDTIIATIDGKQQRVRLLGIDTPESVHPDKSKNANEGKQASDYTKSLVHKGQTLYFEPDCDNTDKYDRKLFYVWLENPSYTNAPLEEAMLNAKLVNDGYAQAKEYDNAQKYADELERLGREASSAQRGITYMWQ